MLLRVCGSILQGRVAAYFSIQTVTAVLVTFFEVMNSGNCPETDALSGTRTLIRQTPGNCGERPLNRTWASWLPR